MSTDTRPGFHPTPLEDRYGAEYLTDGLAHNCIRADCRNCGHCYRTKPGKRHAETCPNCEFPVRLSEDPKAYALPIAYNYKNASE